MNTEQSNYGVTTNEIMDFLKENMVTRREFHEELQRFVTKEDAKAFATKEDLRQFATKEDLKAVATKEDLRAEIGKLRNDLTDFIDRKVSDVRGEHVVLTRKEDGKVLAVVDKLAKKNLLNPEEVKEIHAMEPFPKLTVS